MKVSIICRDINGKRYAVEFDSNYAVLNWLDAGELAEDDEILVVALGNLCLYSALSTDISLTRDDLTGFFA